ncbi:MAG TPA: type II toxin-antitoxin system VapC family toxin [Bryobacteraceae bacterium]|nr:type II toxin-antitoxin system VapC family toxin [Bryobacteraceae bacterium]
MARRAECYVDTSAFIAFLDRSDSFHALFRRLLSSCPPLVTSGLVIAEGHGWFLRRYDEQRASQFLGFIDSLSVLSVKPFSTPELTGLTPVLRRFADQKLTLADAHGLSIMKDLMIVSCWSTDNHLGLTGVPLAI